MSARGRKAGKRDWYAHRKPATLRPSLLLTPRSTLIEPTFNQHSSPKEESTRLTKLGFHPEAGNWYSRARPYSKVLHKSAAFQLGRCGHEEPDSIVAILS